MAQFKRLQTISFLVLLLLVLILVLFILHPFVNIIALALILAILFNPIYERILTKVNRNWLAAAITVILMLLIVALPLFLFGHFLYNELIDLYSNYKNGDLVINKTQIISSLPTQAQTVIQNFSADINSYIGSISSKAFSSVTFIITNVASFLFSAFIMFFIVFFLLRDGDKIKRAVMDVSPISEVHEDKLFDRIVSAVNGVVKGQFVMALIQGGVATIGYFVFGLPQPFIWGMVTVITAIVPNFGTSLTVIPAVIYLLITGQVPQAIGLAIWGTFAVGIIDNFLAPRIVGGKLKLHPVLVLLAVIGGLKFFGPMGFLIGPIIMAIFIELVDMYRTDFKDYFNQ